MANSTLDQKLAFDTELTISATTFDGTAKLVGSLTNNPVKIMFKNQTTVSVFLADNSGSTKGTTMAVGEEIIVDCIVQNYRHTWPKGTAFYVTGAAGTGNFKISIIYAY